MEFTLLFAVLTAVAFLWLASQLFQRRLAGIPHAVDTLIGVASIGLFTGRIGAMILDGVNPITNPLQVILVRAGVDTSIAAMATVAALLWTTRTLIPGWIDALAPVAVAGVAGWHGGCVWRGTCLGTASDLPWAISLSGSTVTRHPVEIYAALAMMAWAVVVDRLPTRPWLPTGAAVAGLALIRLVTEPVRPSIEGGPVWFYGFAVATGVALALLGGLLSGRPGPRSHSG